jgi:hypothetical protein
MVTRRVSLRIAEVNSERIRRRRRRRCKPRFNLRVLFAVMVVTALLCVVGRHVADDVRDRWRVERRIWEWKRQARIKLRAARPKAAGYRDESVHYGETVGSDVMTGDCLIHGKWHRYWAYTSGANRVSPVGHD